MQFSNCVKVRGAKGMGVGVAGGVEDGENNYSRPEAVAQATKGFGYIGGESVLQ